jgi:hypothetical protein
MGCCSGLGRFRNTACAMVRLGLGVMVLPTSHFLDLPPDMQRLILGRISFREMAQLACLSRELRGMYLERVKQRDTAVASLLESHFTPAFRAGLYSTQIALPRDLIADPLVRRLCFVRSVALSSLKAYSPHTRTCTRARTQALWPGRPPAGARTRTHTHTHTPTHTHACSLANAPWLPTKAVSTFCH